MKRFISILLLVILAVSSTACSQQAQPTGESPVPSLEVSETPAAPDATPMPDTAPSPTPELGPYAPVDILGSAFNPYADAGFPDNFNLYAASFSMGAAKLEGRNPYVLSMTAGGKTDESIGFLADLAGRSEDEKNSSIAEYNSGGFCEFQGKNGVMFTIRRTDKGDDRYEYTDGCHIEITLDISSADLGEYAGFVRDNYNLNALAPIAGHLDIVPDLAQCDFSINLHKEEAGVSIVYHIEDADTVLRNIAKDVQSDWYDSENGKMGLAYGMITVGLGVDPRGDGFYVEQTASELGAALSEYVAPETSLTKLGFGFDQEGVCGVYEQHEPHYVSFAVHHPEWGEFSQEWNIECSDSDVNGYSLIIWYYADEDRYEMQMDGKKASAKFDYFPATGQYGEKYPDPDTVRQMYNKAFGTQGEDFHEKPLAHFEQLVQERFGMSIEELYLLPVK